MSLVRQILLKGLCSIITSLDLFTLTGPLRLLFGIYFIFHRLRLLYDLQQPPLVLVPLQSLVDALKSFHDKIDYIYISQTWLLLLHPRIITVRAHGSNKRSAARSSVLPLASPHRIISIMSPSPPSHGPVAIISIDIIINNISTVASTIAAIAMAIAIQLQ